MAEQLYLQMLAVQAEAELGAETAPAMAGGHPSSAPQAAGTVGPSAGHVLGSAPSSIFAGLPADDLEAALDVLLVSAWDGPLEQVRANREELASLLQVEIKTRRVARVLPAAVAARTAAVDQESYQSLLDDAARGGGY